MKTNGVLCNSNSQVRIHSSVADLKSTDPPFACANQKNIRKLVTHRVQGNNWSKIHFLFIDLTGKYSVGWGN